MTNAVLAHDGGPDLIPGISFGGAEMMPFGDLPGDLDSGGDDD